MTSYAWCFSHGRLHCFDGEPWCSARERVLLPGATEEQALAAKRERYGDAHFLDQLPDGQALAVIFGGRPWTQ